MDNKKINFAIIGAGNMAAEYAKILKYRKDAYIIGIYSRTYLKARVFAKKKMIKKIYKNLNLLLEDSNIDIIIVCVSDENVGSVLKKIVKTKKIILTEKPIGLSYLEAKKNLDEAIKNKTKLFIALNRRYYPSTMELQKILSKKLSQNKRVLEVFDCQIKRSFIKLKKHKKVIESLMYANSVHLIDYFSMFCRGELKEIKNITTNKKNSEIIFSIIKFSSGDIGYYHCSWNQNSRWKIKLTIKDFKEWTFQPLESLSEFDQKLNKLNFIKNYKYKFKPGLEGIVNDLINQFYKKKNNLVSPKEHLKTIKIINKIYGK